MAAVVALMAKDRGGPSIRFQALMWPVTDANFVTPNRITSLPRVDSLHKRNMMNGFGQLQYRSKRAIGNLCLSIAIHDRGTSWATTALIQTAGNDVFAR